MCVNYKLSMYVIGLCFNEFNILMQSMEHNSAHGCMRFESHIRDSSNQQPTQNCEIWRKVYDLFILD